MARLVQGLVQHFEINTQGRDYSVGDIHGHFTRLSNALQTIGFDPEKDRLFACGDLVDRGPESHHAIEWLNEPWFHSVRGNHDGHVARHDEDDPAWNWLGKAGVWFDKFSPHIQSVWAHVFDKLPIVIDVATVNGTVGIVHADNPFPRWDTLVERLTGDEGPKRLKLLTNACMYSRRRTELREDHGVEDIVAMIVGHQPVPSVLQLGNVYHIDTMGWRDGGRFTFIDLNTLQTVEVAHTGERHGS